MDKGGDVVMKKRVIAVILIALIFGITVTGYAQGEKPPLSGWGITDEILLGEVGAFGGAFAGMFFGQLVGALVAMLAGETKPTDRALTIVENTEAIVALTAFELGSALAVYLAGREGNKTGSFKATLGGSVLGTLGFGALAISLNRIFPDHFGRGATIAMFLAGPPIGATIGFNMTRRYKSPPAPETALINLRNGQFSLAVPAIYSYSADRRTLSLNLVRVAF